MDSSWLFLCLFPLLVFLVFAIITVLSTGSAFVASSHLLRLLWLAVFQSVIRSKSSQCLPTQNSTYDINRHQSKSDPGRVQDAVPEYIEHVVSVVCKRKWMDDCVEPDDCQAQGHKRAVACNFEEACIWAEGELPVLCRGLWLLAREEKVGNGLYTPGHHERC